LANELVLLDKEEMVLQGMFDKTNGNWKMLRNGNECGKS
jgi:hypothetical protein